MALLLTVSIAAKAIGSLQPINPALRGFVEGCEDKPQPCWYGIVPGVTTFEEATKLLDAQGYSINTNPSAHIKYDAPQNSMLQFVQFNYYSEESGIIYLMVLALTNEVRLGDFVAQLGRPNWINIYSVFDPIHLEYTNPAGTLGINIGSGFTMSPFRQNLQVVVLSSMEIVQDNSSHDWHGFIPARNYCDLEHIMDEHCS